MTAEEQTAIKAAVGDKLLDPESARYKLGPQMSSTFYCGQVNAKNSFGAYVGFRPFQAMIYNNTSSETSAVVLGMGDDDSSAVGVLCRAAGY